MTSKLSFLNLIKENLKHRLWSIAMSILAFFFMFPVFTIMFISSHAENLDVTQTKAAQMKYIIEFFTSYYNLDNTGLKVILTILVVIIAINGFSYLHSKDRVDFYHSLPIKRGSYFSTVYINGLIIILIPYFVFSLISALIAASYSGASGLIGTALSGFMLHSLLMLMAYSLTIVAVMLTGHMFISILGSLIFFFYLPMVIYLFDGLCNTYLDTYLDIEENISYMALHSSVITYSLSKVDFNTNPINPTSIVITSLLWSIAFTALGYFLYNKRKSEAATHAMAFNIVKAPIKFLLVIPCALLAAMVFTDISYSFSLPWSLFGLICGLIISHCVIEIIYHFDFKKLFSKKIELLICGIISLAILISFRYDLFSYDSYIPKENDIVGIGITSDRIESNTENLYNKIELSDEYNSDYQNIITIQNYNKADYLKSMNYSDKQFIMSFARHLVNTNQYDIDNEYDNYNDYANITVCYHLKNGKHVYRYYSSRIYTDFAEELDRIHDSKEFKNASYPVLGMDSNSYVSINLYSYGNTDKFYSRDDSSDKKYSNQYVDKASLKSSGLKAELIEAYKKELGSLSAETRKNENPICNIRFNTEDEDIAALYAYKDNFNTPILETGYYPVYPSFTKTIDILKKLGLETDYIYNIDNIKELTIHYGDEETMETENVVEYDYMGYEHSYEYSEKEMSSPRKEYKVSDKEVIRSILNKAQPYKHDFYYYNDYFISDPSVSISFVMENNSNDEVYYDMCFKKGEVPEFVQDMASKAK